ncbi:response regulator transcription factor [Actinomadura meridiana]|uniref:Response regulator transcription factor n=1 Tax=Actinomadura meridiana TaxID=559626 RepID=A0ABP8C4J5_9ACTN
MKVVIVENQGLYLDLLTDALRSRGIDVVGRATEPDSALRVIDETAPDLAVLDIRLTDTADDEGLRLAELARAQYPDVALLAFSAFLEPAYAERLLTIEDVPRAIGYLGKERLGNLDELVEACHRIVRGDVVIDPEIISKLMARRRTENPLDRLTPTELRVLALIAEGYSNLGIAQRLNTKISTTEHHISTIANKLGTPPTNDPRRPHLNIRVLAALTYLNANRT